MIPFRLFSLELPLLFPLISAVFPEVFGPVSFLHEWFLNFHLPQCSTGPKKTAQSDKPPWFGFSSGKTDWNILLSQENLRTLCLESSIYEHLSNFLKKPVAKIDFSPSCTHCLVCSVVSFQLMVLSPVSVAWDVHWSMIPSLLKAHPWIRRRSMY